MWKSMTYFAFSLPNRPGELANFMRQLSEKDINLLGMWGYASGEEEPRLSCVPQSPEKFRAIAAEHGLDIEAGETFYLTASDEPGALIDTLQRISDAGVNVDAIEAVTAGDEFGCFLWADQSQWKALEGVLKPA